MLLKKLKEYNKIGYFPTCPICNKEITREELGNCEMIRTKRKTTVFVHKTCLMEGMRNANKN